MRALQAIRRAMVNFQHQNCRLQLVVLRRQLRHDARLIRACQDKTRTKALARQIADTADDLVDQRNRLIALSVKRAACNV